MTKNLKTDLCVIGAGSGGLSVAAGAAQMGAKVVLIEGGEMGGDCLNYGCVPSKALIASSKQAQAMRNGANLGIAPVQPKIDFAAVKDHVQNAINVIAPHDSQERFESLGVTVIRAYGRFVAPNMVEADGVRITARRFVIATGSSPFIPPIPGLDAVKVYTNETIFDLRARPDHLVIIGAGPIGLEMAQAHRRLGSRVTVIEGAQALGKDDPELAAIVVENLRAEGVEIVENSPVTRVEKSDEGIMVHTPNGTHKGTHLLVAVGRKVSLDRLNLDAGQVAYDRAVTVKNDLRSISNKRVYAVGDAAGSLQFTHVAGYHAGVVIRSALFGLPSKAKTNHLPWATYTDPELAQVGLSEADARAKFGSRLEVIRFPYAQNDRAIADTKTRGLIKVMIVKGKPVGASIVGHLAGEMIGIWAMAIANKMKMSAIAGTVLPYPTYSEINKRAAGAYFSPRLFENAKVKQAVRFIQRWLP